MIWNVNVKKNHGENGLNYLNFKLNWNKIFRALKANYHYLKHQMMNNGTQYF